MFYVDIEGHADDPVIRGAMVELREHTTHLKVLGSYPSRTGEQGPPRDLAGIAARAAASPIEPLKPGELDVPPEPRPRIEVGTASAPFHARTAPGTTAVRVGNVIIGAERFVLIAGPCAVESRTQVHAAAEMVKQHGVAIMRAGAFRPSSSPYSFQGLGLEGLEMLVEAGHTFEMPVVTEVTQAEDVRAIAERADMLLVGSRNMQNYALLRALGKVDRPILLKRGMSATVDELLLAAEHVMDGGNNRVVLCERGIRTFETATQATLDLSAVLVLRERTHLPVLVDPSHAAGRCELVAPLALAAAAAGADGLIVEAHPEPMSALCDREQALSEGQLAELVARLGPVVAAVGRRL